MTDVLDLQAVTIRRGTTTILDEVSWTVARASGGSSWAATARARPPCSRSRPAACTPPAAPRSCSASGWAGSTSSSSGPASACPAPRSRTASRGRAVRDVVLTAAYGVTGRWREDVRGARRVAGRPTCSRVRGRPPRRPLLRHAERGRAQARPDRPLAHDRPRAAAARRARRRPRPRRPRGARRGARRARGRPQVPGARAGDAPRRGDPARLHPPAAAEGRPGARGRPCREVLTARDALRARSGSTWLSTATATLVGRQEAEEPTESAKRSSRIG